MPRRVVLTVLAAASCLAAACVVSRAAETPVGLEARGLDAAAVLSAPSGLDLRDELGRPVSAALVEKQLKAAAAEAASQAAYSSRLPSARTVLRLVELWRGLQASLGRTAGRAPDEAPTAAPARPSPRLLPAGAGLPAGVPAEHDLAASSRPFPPAAFRGGPLVLRC